MEGSREDPDRRWYRDRFNWVIIAMSAVVLALLIALCREMHRSRGGCASPEAHFVSTTIDLLGYKCNHRLLYGLSLVFSLALQILRSCLSSKEWQVRRDALKTPRGSRARPLYLGQGAGYTFVGFSLYIISILFLVSKNLGVLVMLLVGTMVGNMIVVHLIDADRYTPYYTIMGAPTATPSPFTRDGQT